MILVKEKTISSTKIFEFDTLWCIMGKSCLLVALTLLLMTSSSFSSMRCTEHELEALLKLKHSFTADPMNRLSSWVGDDCCRWLGVTCDSVTGNVIRLNLRRSLDSAPLMSSELSPALSELMFLQYLDLSYNFFNGSRIPDFIGSMTTLRYLNLSGVGFSGRLPPQLGNLTNLTHLDLSNAVDTPQQSLEWASRLSKPQTLDMDLVDLSQASDSVQLLFLLPSLSMLSLQYTDLHEVIVTNTSNTTWSSTLQHLDLSYNNFEGHLPSFLNNMRSLRFLSVSSNNFSGSIPQWLGNMSRLKHLDLSNNKLSGQIPVSLSKLLALTYLDLSRNVLSGLIPEILGHFTKMEYLDISSNSIEGTVSNIGNLSRLFFLNMNFNKLRLDWSINWRPAFQLDLFGAHSCEINTVFPQWFRNQTRIRALDLSYTGISGELPTWVWNMTDVIWLELAGNQFTGSLPRDIACDGCNLAWLDLHNNMLQGSIPHWFGHLQKLGLLDLSGNLLSGAFFERGNSSSLFNSDYLVLLDLSDNMFSGEIRIKNVDPGNTLQILSLRGNEFTGIISPRLCLLESLMILDLAQNHFTGHVPRCLGTLTFESDQGLLDTTAGAEIHEIINRITQNFAGTKGIHSMIDLSSNHLVGTIPEELTNISKLIALNLSFNRLTGSIPTDMESMKLLESLDLSSNKLSGMIPQSLSAISWLSSLNLSNNNLHGSIPTGHQLQTLDDPSIYAGNSGLCGFPLPVCIKSNQSPSATDDDRGAEKDNYWEDKRETMWFCLVVMSGVATGFWGVVGTLVLKKRWRRSFFTFVEETADRIYVPFKVRINRFTSRRR